MDGLLAEEYGEHIKKLRASEYPSLDGAIYLDHAGTTPIPKSLIERFSLDMVSNLYGNPHSASPSSQLSTRKVEDIRHDALRFFNADPADFDLVFVANATAGAKLVMDAFRDTEAGFWYGYHKDSHTSLVGVRELARLGSHCFASDEELEEWIQARAGVNSNDTTRPLELFAYPAQSNMNGRRLPLDWCQKIRQSSRRTHSTTYTLLDAAALVSTSPLDLSDAQSAPDFTVLSFYKIFGFPDLGALIVRKESGDILRRRRYFGGGTVDMVVCLKEQWHAKKIDSLHGVLEDGTLPIHNILALRHAMDVHCDIFGSLKRISQHTSRLAKGLHHGLCSLRHANGVLACVVYKDPRSSYDDLSTQGPIVAFNLRTSSKAWVSNTEFEKLAAIKNIHLRTGGLCNPGGIASSLGLEPWEMNENFAAGQRCGGENDIMNGKPTGAIRASLGGMSTSDDVDQFLDFLREFFVETTVSADEDRDILVQSVSEGEFYVESLTIYPIKSCGAWRIPADTSWEVKNEGLAWDREWCLLHRGTGAALSQKRHPKMALIRPSVDFNSGVLRIRYTGAGPSNNEEITVPLSADPRVFKHDHSSDYREQDCNVCGDDICTKTYTSEAVSNFFTSALGVPCQLARFPSRDNRPSTRHSKAHLHTSTKRSHDDRYSTIPRPILFSNESPILTISRSSLNRLNEQIKSRHGKATQAESFRANIVVAQETYSRLGIEQPYAEDSWTDLDIGGYSYQILGACRRCQMVCVDQQTGEKDQEPFVTLAKTRRREGKVWFGVHTCVGEGQRDVRIRVGDRVKAVAYVSENG